MKTWNFIEFIEKIYWKHWKHTKIFFQIIEIHRIFQTPKSFPSTHLESNDFTTKLFFAVKFFMSLDKKWNFHRETIQNFSLFTGEKLEILLSPIDQRLSRAPAREKAAEKRIFYLIGGRVFVAIRWDDDFVSGL